MQRIRLRDAKVLEKEPDGNCVLNCYLENDDPRPGGRAVEDPGAVYALRSYLADKLIEYQATEVCLDNYQQGNLGTSASYTETHSSRFSAGTDALAVLRSD